MNLYNRKSISKFRKEDKGSFTLEATLVFPTIFISTIVLLLVSIIIFERVSLYQKAYVIAERVAFTWDNSSKDFTTGSFSRNQYTTENGDGLYWRSKLMGGAMVEEIFGQTNRDAITELKLANARIEAQQITEGRVDTLRVDTSIVNPKVHVTLSGTLNLPQIVNYVFPTEIQVTGTASIKDPVELIRTTDFIIHYGGELIDQFRGPTE